MIIPFGIRFPPPLTIGLVIGIESLFVALFLWLAAPIIARRWPRQAWLASVGRLFTAVVGFVLVVAAIVGEQTPTTDLANPVPDTVTSAAAGAELYQANCARCHGVDGLGGGPDAGTTQARPANLRSGHLNSHTDGDIYYWVTYGLPGGMPAWGSTLTETDRWNLVNYLRSINGRGPAPAPSATNVGSVGPPDSLSLLLAPALAILLIGWFATGRLRRRRKPHPPSCEPIG